MYSKLYSFFGTTFIDIVGNITDLFDSFFVTTLAEHVASMDIPENLRAILADIMQYMHVPVNATLASLMFGTFLFGVLLYSLIKWAMPF